jgi:hypothetical protein
MAIFYSFFKSKNDLSKALAYYILIYLLGIYLFNLPYFISKYLLNWIAVATIFNPSLRFISNDDLKMLHL